MHLESLTDSFGASVTHLDLRTRPSRDTLRELCAALYEHRVLVIRGQRLTRDQYLDFGRRMGTPIPHVLDHMRMRGYPEMMTVGNTESRDLDPKIRNGAALWHTDQSYEAKPANATMLYSLIAPSTGGETQFCDMAGAYDDLPADRRAELANLDMAHKYGYGKRRHGEVSANPIINDEQDNRVPPVYHPLVMTHPVTGRRALYALGHGAYGIKGLPEAKANELIEALKDHVLQERYLYRHPYAVGDVVIWDTLQTMHSATPIDPMTTRIDARLLWRISVRGTPPELGTQTPG